MSKCIMIEITADTVEPILVWIHKAIKESEEYCKKHDEYVDPQLYRTRQILEDINYGIIDKAIFPADYIGY